MGLRIYVRACVCMRMHDVYNYDRARAFVYMCVCEYVYVRVSSIGVYAPHPDAGHIASVCLDSRFAACRTMLLCLIPVQSVIMSSNE